MNQTRFLLFLLVAAACCSGPVYSAQREFGKILDAREGKALAEDVIAQRPEKDAVFYGTLKMRDGDGRRRHVPIKYAIKVGDDGWQGVYETQATNGLPAQRLAIIHKLRQPTQYILTPIASAGISAPDSSVLRGPDASIPFVGSDYWLSDLGLEFLHWPDQRLIKDAKISMRSNRSCKVLESTNPNPTPGDYARVVSWLDAESGAPIYVEAYGKDTKLLKIFSLHKFQKVNGRWHPTDLELRNEKTDSRTSLQLQFETE